MTINNVSGVRSDITDMLAKIREVSNKTKIFSESNQISSPKSFEQVLSVAKGAMSSVSNLQTETEALKTALISGDPNVSMAQVVVASQKSKLAFDGLITVRNKILEAYKEIMNMQV